MLVAPFPPTMVMRLREALEKTLTEQLRAVVDRPRPVSPSMISAASYIFILRDFDRPIYLSFSCWKCSICPTNSNPSHRQPQYPSPTKLGRNFFQYFRSATSHLLSTIEVKIAGPTASQVSFEDLPELQTFISRRTFITRSQLPIC